jgi:ABC-type transporter Mla subunit MlaD
LVDKGSVLTPTAESLRNLLAQSNSQSERLDATLRNLADILTAAAKGIRQIEAKV